MHDLDKPLKIVNKTLWEELSGYTENEVCKSLLFLFLPYLRGPWKCDEFTSMYLLSQFRSFGAKLKQRNNFFRKTSKVRSHEMKEELYSDLVQANQVRAVMKHTALSGACFIRAWKLLTP